MVVTVFNPNIKHNFQHGSQRTVSIQEIMTLHDDCLSDTMRSESGHTDNEHKSQEFFRNRGEDSTDQPLNQVENLKEEVKRCHPTNTLIQSYFNDVNTDSGTLWSNRVVTFLSIAKGMSFESAIRTLKKVIDDCDAGLKSSWVNLIPERILTKLLKRKEDAKKNMSVAASKKSS